MQFAQLISDFASQNGLQVSGDPDSGASVECVFDDGASTVEFAPLDRSNLRMQAEIAAVDPATEDGTRVLTTLLKGNLALLRDQRNAITLADDGTVLLFEKVAIRDVEMNGFTEMVESFLNSLGFLKKGLADSI